MSFDLICICIDARMKYIIRQLQMFLSYLVTYHFGVVAETYHLKKQRDKQED